MVAYDYNQAPTIKEALYYKLTRRLNQAEKAKRNTRARTLFQSSMRLLLHIVGFSCFTLAGFSVTTTVGLIAATIACFTMSWLMTQSQSPPDKRTLFDRVNQE